MQNLVIFTALALLGGAPLPVQDAKPLEAKPAVAATPTPQESTPASARDFFLFTKALRPLREGILTSQVKMDIQGEGIAVTLRSDIRLTHKATGAFMSELTVTPPGGAKPKRYKVTHSGKTTWVQDLGAGTYAIQKVTEDNEFMVQGLLTGLALKALEKLDATQLKLLDAAEPTPELAAALEMAVKSEEGTLKVRDELRGTRTYRVYDLATGGAKGEVLSIFVGPDGKPDRLLMHLDQEKLKINFSEIILNLTPTVPTGARFRFTPTRATKKVKQIDLGSF
jgi:hypothetical protein